MALLVSTHPSHKTTSVATSLIALASVVALLYYGRDFFVTLIVSAVFACILDPIVMLVMKLRIPRPAATGIVIGLALVAVYLLSLMAWMQIATIREDLPTYSSRVLEVSNKVNDKLTDLEKRAVASVVPKALQQQDQQIQQKPQEALKARRRRAGLPPAQVTPPPKPEIQEVRVHTDPKPAIATLYSYVAGYFHVLVMASFVPFLVYFMLSWHHHVRSATVMLFRMEHRHTAYVALGMISAMIRSFMVGNLLIGLFLGAISTLIFWAVHVPFFYFVGFVSGFLSLVPYLGVVLAIAPPLFVGMEHLSSQDMFAITIAIIALHLVALNVLYPKFLGNRMQLNPLAVTMALLLWAWLWGAMGLVLAVPITAAMKIVFDHIESLKPYGAWLGE